MILACIAQSVCKELLIAKADPAKRDKYKRTAFDVASFVPATKTV